MTRSIDTTVKALSRFWPRGHRLVWSFGRGIVVRRRNQGPGGFIGLVMLAAGIAGMVWANIEDFNAEGIGRVGVVVGVLLVCSARLEKRTEANDQNYYLGKDIGYEEGFAAAQREQRPVVVDLDARRCKCRPGKCEADLQAERLAEPQLH